MTSLSEFLSLGGKRPSVHVMIFGGLAFLGPSVLGTVVPEYVGITGLMSVVSSMCMVLVNASQSLSRQLAQAAITTTCGAITAAAAAMLAIAPNVTMFVFVGLVFGLGALAASLNPALAGAGALLPILGYFMLASQDYSVENSVATAIALICGWLWTAVMLTFSFLTSDRSARTASIGARQALANVVDVIDPTPGADADRNYSQARRLFTNAYNEALERTQIGRGSPAERGHAYSDLAQLGQVASLLLQLRVHWLVDGDINDATATALRQLAVVLRSADSSLTSAPDASKVARQLRNAAGACPNPSDQELLERLARALTTKPSNEDDHLPALQLGPGQGWYLNWRLPHIVLAHAARYVVAGLISVAVYELVGTADSLWMLLTVAVVMKPTLGALFQRFSQRVCGTVIGAVLGIGFALALDASPTWVALLAPAVVMGIGLSFMSINYFYWVICLTPVIVAITVPGHLSVETPIARIFFTLLGAGLCLALGTFLWPSRAQVLIPAALSKVAEQLLTLINWESTPTTERETWVTVRARSVNALVQASETTTMCRREPSANAALCDRADWAITCAALARDEFASYPETPRAHSNDNSSLAPTSEDQQLAKQIAGLTHQPWSVPSPPEGSHPTARAVIVANLCAAYGRVQDAANNPSRTRS